LDTYASARSVFGRRPIIHNKWGCSGQAIPLSLLWVIVTLRLLITTYETVASLRLWESGIHHALEDHQFIGEYIPMVSLTFWQKLTSSLQHLFTDLWEQKVAACRIEMEAAQSRARELIEQHGIKIVTLPPEELAAKRQEMMVLQDHVAKLSRISSEMLIAVSADSGAG
jgi:TRAP-type C4-dicarboxylate transport system substrate-binding protein